MPNLITLSEAAKILQMDEEQLRQWNNAKRIIGGKKIAGKHIFDADTLRRKADLPRGRKRIEKNK